MRNRDGSKFRTGLIAYLVCLALQVPGYAWHAAGHSMVASIAYRDLKSADRDAIVAILRQHQDFRRLGWQAGASASRIPEGEYYFMRAATWPDEIRPQPHEVVPEHHPLWHYINLPIDRPGTRPHALPQHRPADMFDTDAVQCLQVCYAVVRAPNSTAADRAKALAWIIHVVGDLQQPLHGAALLSDRFDSGDHGGNSFSIKPARGASNLHGYWDGLFDELRSPAAVSSRAQQIAHSNPRNLLPAASDLKPVDWAGEDRSLADSFAYSFRNTDLVPGAELPDGYEASARGQAEPRIALGGYRLAATLSWLLHNPGPNIDQSVLAKFRNPELRRR